MRQQRADSERSERTDSDCKERSSSEHRERTASDCKERSGKVAIRFKFKRNLKSSYLSQKKVAIIATFPHLSP